jgi:hypothetical protein
MLQVCLHVTTIHTCGLSMRRLSFKGCTCLSLGHFHPNDIHSPVLLACCLLSLTMPRFHVNRIRAAVWKWLCKCPDVIGLVGDISSDEEFFTPPTNPLPGTGDQDVGGNLCIPSCIIAPAGDAQWLLSPAQTRRLRRRHIC